MTRCVPVVFALSVFCLANCTSPAPQQSSQSQPIVGGVDNTSDSSVVALMGFIGTDSFLCTGVVIAPRTVLTSAHCLHQRDSIDVVFGLDIEEPGSITATLAADSWEGHPQWDPNPTDLFDRRFDVGLITLPSDAPVPAVLWNRIELEDAMLGTTVRLVGFGNTSNAGFDSGRRRQASTELRDFDMFWTTAGGVNANTCVGDSGGPQLMDIGGAEVVMGLTSFGTAPPNEELCKFDSIAARTDIAADFIDSYVEANDTPGPCGADDACSASCAVPEQDPDCQTLCVGDGTCEPDCGQMDPDCSGEPGPDAGVTGQDEDSGGGGCSTSGGTRGSVLIALLALALIARRRR